MKLKQITDIGFKESDYCKGLIPVLTLENKVLEDDTIVSGIFEHSHYTNICLIFEKKGSCLLCTKSPDGLSNTFEIGITIGQQSLIKSETFVLHIIKEYIKIHATQEDLNRLPEDFTKTFGIIKEMTVQQYVLWLETEEGEQFITPHAEKNAIRDMGTYWSAMEFKAKIILLYANSVA